MNILIDARSLTKDQLSGVGLYTLEVIEHLLTHNSDNTYVLWSNSYSDVSESVLFQKMHDWQSVSNVTHVHTTFPNKLLHTSFAAFGRPHIDRMVLKRLPESKGIKEFDWFFMPNLHFYAISRRLLLMAAFHDLSWELFPEFFPLKGRIWHKVARPQSVCRRARSIVAVSESTKETIRRIYRIPAPKIKAIYPGIPGQAAEKPFDEIQKKYTLPDNYILYLGALEPRKNVRGIVEAYSRVAHHDWCPPLVLAGVEGWLNTDVHEAATASKYRDQIHFVGFIDKDDKRAFLKRASVFVYPSFFEGFGFPPLEAMRAGTPVIASTGGSLPEVLGDAALLVDPYNIGEIAQSIEHVLTGSSLREALITKGRAQARIYTWDRTTKELLEVFKGR